ncbi:MAG: ABC transporter permease [Acidimicrobiia bacterium]
MAALIAKKFAKFVGVVLAVTLFASFLLSLLPGDAVSRANPTATAEQKAAIAKQLGLNDPLIVRWWHWITNAAHLDFGRSLTRGTPVWDLVRDAIVPTLQLVILAQLVALAVAIPLGVWSAQRANRTPDKVVSVSTFMLIAIPNFVLAITLSVYVGSVLGWLPPSGYTSFSDDPGAWFQSMILPTLALAAGQIAIYQRLLRSDLIATLQSDFITTARAKGISDRRVLWRHALRPSSFSLLTVAAINTGALVGGAVVIEVIFGLPGMGKRLFESYQNLDYPTFQAVVAVIAIGYVALNFVVDIIYTVLDPRTRDVARA